MVQVFGTRRRFIKCKLSAKLGRTSIQQLVTKHPTQGLNETVDHLCNDAEYTEKWSKIQPQDEQIQLSAVKVKPVFACNFRIWFPFEIRCQDWGCVVLREIHFLLKVADGSGSYRSQIARWNISFIKNANTDCSGLQSGACQT